MRWDLFGIADEEMSGVLYSRAPGREVEVRYTSTHTYAILKISPEAYREIRILLDEAGYSDQFLEGSRGDELIDMHGLALQARSQVEMERAAGEIPVSEVKIDRESFFRP